MRKRPLGCIGVGMILLLPFLTLPSRALACVVGTGTTASCVESALDTCLPRGGSFDHTMTFNCGGAHTITVTSGKEIAADTTIDGGRLITISGGNSVGVFSVSSGVTFTVKNLIIANGNTGSAGGAIISANGTVIITNSTISDNNASMDGGGLQNFFGSVIVNNSTFSRNSAEGNGGGIETYGGTVIVTNSTFFGNSAHQGGAIDNNGGEGGATVNVTNSTFSSNGASTFSFNYYPGMLSLTNSIFAEGCDAYSVDGGHNIDARTTCGFSSRNGSWSNTNPQLDPAGLVDNGGPTQTIALKAGSPAINGGDERVCSTATGTAPVDNVDQRGFSRPGTGAANCSIGAFEANSAGASLDSFSVVPRSGRDRVLSTHTVTAKLTNPNTGVPVAGSLIGFAVTSGPNIGASGTCAPSNCATDASGQVTWSYQGAGGPGVDSILTFVDSNGNGIRDTGEAQATAAEVWFRQRLAYYALGDSIASGHGLPHGGDVPKDTSGNPTCQVSTTDAYPVRVYNGLRTLPQYTTTFRQLACTGAKTSASSPPRPAPLTDLPQQIDQFLLDAATFPPDQLALVSITIGADDFDFTDEIIHGTNICNPDVEFGQWVASTSSTVEFWLVRGLGRLLTTPNTYIVVTDYFNPFNKESGYFDIMRNIPSLVTICDADLLLPKDRQDARCQELISHGPYNSGCATPGGLPFFARTERAIGARTTDPTHLKPSSLDQAILNAVALEMGIAGKGNRLGVVTIHDAFQGHESAMPNCGSAAPDLVNTYIQYPSFPIGIGTLRSMGAAAFESQLAVGNDCIHMAPPGTILYRGLPASQGVLDVAKQLLP